MRRKQFQTIVHFRMSTQERLLFWCLGFLMAFTLAIGAPACRSAMPVVTAGTGYIMLFAPLVCKTAGPWVVTTTSNVPSTQSITCSSKDENHCDCPQHLHQACRQELVKVGYLYRVMLSLYHPCQPSLDHGATK